MINDPLLNTNTAIPPSPPVARTARTSGRKKHPAISARILATGLSVTALIGLTTGYTLSQKVSAAQPAIPESIVSNVAQTSPIDAGVITATTEVIYVPVPERELGYTTRECSRVSTICYKNTIHLINNSIN